MRLKKLCDDNINQIENKKIYCYEKSLTYLEELRQKYAILDQIEAVIDDNAKNQGLLEINGRKINVQGSEMFEQIDWTSGVVLITSDCYNEAYEKLCAVSAVNKYLDVIYYFENQETAYEMEQRGEIL